MVQRVKGTQDFLSLTLFNFLISSIRKHLSLYNFTEISTPILEPTELFKRSLGLETDIITKEMYQVKTDHSDGDESICLRPEITASVVRAFIDNSIDITPWKVFSWGPVFRHERPQKGRFRQFNQITLEAIGSASVSQDVQLIKMLDRFFSESLSLDSYALLINYLGCAQDRSEYKSTLKTFLNPVADQLCGQCQVRKEKNILRVFDCKNESCQKIYEQAPQLIQSLCTTCSEEWQTVQDQLEALSVSYSYKPTLVRGLDYYDKTVFEFVSLDLGAQNAFCGGGRYSQLAQKLGARHDQPSVGAAIGVERILMLLESRKEKLILEQQPVLHMVLPLAQAQHDLALLVADELQAQHLCVDLCFEGDSVKSMMRKADKLGARWVLIIGSDEQQAGQVTVKNMTTGSEEKVAQKDLVSYLRK